MVSPGALRLTQVHTKHRRKAARRTAAARHSHSDRVQTPTCKYDIRERSVEPYSGYQRGQSETARPGAAAWTCRLVPRSGAKAESSLV